MPPCTCTSTCCSGDLRIGAQTRCVRNVTDVDDDILRKSRELGVHYLDLAAEEMARFDAEMGLLNLLPVYSEPRATSAIPEILSLVGASLERGHAYESGGSVYFDVASFPEFGRISGYGRADMLRLAAEHGGNPDDPRKRDPLDFVLWQPSLSDEPAWGSRWGSGRPGWHIECSALGAARPGRDDRYPRRRARPGLPPSRVRDGPIRIGDRAAIREGVVPRRPGRIWVARRCRSRSAIWCSSVTSARSGSRRQFGWPCWPITIGVTGTGRRTWTCPPLRRGWRSGAASTDGDGDAGLEQVRAALDADLDTAAALEALDVEALCRSDRSGPGRPCWGWVSSQSGGHRDQRRFGGSEQHAEAPCTISADPGGGHRVPGGDMSVQYP